MTVTPCVTLAAIRFEKPAPGSKKPEPDVKVPVIVTVVEDWPADTLESDDAGVAGGGAMSCANSTPDVPVPSQNSWTVQMVMSSFGSTEQKE